MSSQNLGVQTGELGKFANDLRLSAGVVGTSAQRVSQHMFGDGSNGHGPEAGRNYVSQGAAIHTGLENVVQWLENWGAAGKAVADSIGAATVVYSDTDAEAAKKTRQQTQNV
ncbi:hypothetical protein REK76_04225 [Nocardia farcinica]|uniref:hypothetical protein n=1 Tax=Nocardia farcinica TaxID=37329 RepID=UPI00189436CF|nr:hypothetical protein [Nocardia farcinica]MBF6268440.1 hypothetical protein [Nocardia farcinica]MBF6574606.1 hypothetical protein [Nocardia farcinica]MCZ9327748.1 hypothetical protein [Nocardia farcinica]